MAMDAYERLSALGLTLPKTPKAAGNYIPAKLCGEMLYLAGQGPQRPDGSWCVGKVGKDVSLEEAYQHARLVGLQLLGVIHDAVGDLNRVEVIKLRRLNRKVSVEEAGPMFEDTEPLPSDSVVTAGMDDIIVLVVRHLDDLVRRSRCLTASDKRVTSCTTQPILLYLDGRAIVGLEPESGAPISGDAWCMGREPRPEVPGGLYHPTWRGNNRAAIVGTDTTMYWTIASEPTPMTFPPSSWNGVAAARTTSITREFFSSATL